MLTTLLVASTGLAALPTVTAAAATGIDATNATLNAFVNANNEDTTVSFEYKISFGWDPEDPPPDTIAGTPSPVTGSGFTAVSANLSGLTPGTVYSFRAVATNASGTTSGSILLFLTDPPATVATGIASPVTTTTAQLNGTVNANGNSTTVTFEYGMTTSYGTTVTADQSPVTGSVDTAVSKTITGLTPNTTYHFRVVGDNALGTSYGDDHTFSTKAQTAPTVTTDDATFSFLVNQATLHGTVNANNADTTVTFEYGTTTAYGTTVTADESPVLGSQDTAVSKLITGLTANTTYHFRVVAVNGIGTTNGADMTFFNTAAPYARTDAASQVSITTVTLNGTVNPKTLAEGSTTVTFEYGLTASYGTTVSAIESPIGGGYNQQVNVHVTGLSPNTTYHFRVVADNVNGTGTGADMTFTTSSLPWVTTQTAAPVGTTSATLNGTVNANNDSTTVTFEYGTTTAYGTTVSADQSPVTGSTDTAVSKAITGLAASTTYHFRVVGTNSSGTAMGDDLTFTTGVSPPAVTTQAATGVGATAATLHGTINANGLSTSAYFEWGETTAYGRTGPAVPGTITGSTPTPVDLVLGTLLPDTTYHFRLVGQSAAGTVYGADMSLTTPSAPTVTTTGATSVTTTGATLNGIVNAHGESTTVTFEYGTTTAYGTTVTADQSPVTGSTDTAVSTAITGLTPSTTYHFRAVGTNATGASYGADIVFSTSVGPPIVTTGSASPLVTGAILHGTANANNASTTVTFEYGTTIAYGSTATADQSPVTGSSATTVTATISGLSFNTTYHYRVVGSNSNGTTNGADMTFVTTLYPSATTGAATDILATEATLHGTANGNGGVWSVRFDYGLTIAYGSTVTAVPNLTSDSIDIPVSAVASGLTPNTTYHYRATVYSGGFTYPGSDMTFTTLNGPLVTTDAASSVGSSTARLNATVNAHNESTTVAFEWGLETSYGQVVGGTPSPVSGNTNTSVSADLTALTPLTTYHYRARGSNASGTVNGVDMSFTTTGLPPAATTTAASSVMSTSATLNGTVNANNDTTTVTFEYGTTTSYGTTVTADQSPVTGTSNTAVSKAITGLSSSTVYHYRVVGQNAVGTTNGADMTFNTGGVAPIVSTGTPTGISSTGATLHGVVNDNGLSTTVLFEIWSGGGLTRQITADQSPVTGGIQTAVSVTLTDLAPDTSYTYRIVATNGAGTTYGAEVDFATTGPPIVTTSAATVILTAQATLNGTVNANSNSTTVSFEYGLDTSYGMTIAATPSPVTGTSPTAVSAVVSGLTPNTIYHFRVIGDSGAGTSEGADMTFITASPPTVTTGAATALTLSGATLNGTVDANREETTVTFEYGLDTGYGSMVTADQSPVTGDVDTPVSATITGLDPDTTYHFRVVGENGSGTTAGADMTFITAAPPAVSTQAATAVTVYDATLNGTVDANRESTTVTFEYGLDTGYGSTVTADQSPVTGDVDTPVSATITGLDPDTTYHFRVVGTNPSGTTDGNDMTFTTEPLAEVLSLMTAPGMSPLDECDTVPVALTGIMVTFSKPVLEADQATSYLLVNGGPDQTPDTLDCVGPFGDDVSVPLSGISVDSSPTTPTATLSVANLSGGPYRLLVCDAITDVSGASLDGDGDGSEGGHLLVNFRLDPGNLFANGHFDDCPVTLAPWVTTAAAPDAVLPSIEDKDDAPRSGSMEMFSSQVDEKSAAQCIPLAATSTYELTVSLQIDPGATPAVATFIRRCELFDQAACSGSSLGLLTFSDGVTGTGGAWNTYADQFVTPLSTSSGWCELIIVPVAASTSDFNALLDGVFLGLGPSTTESIFSDGFESGDASSWSSVTP